MSLAETTNEASPIDILFSEIVKIDELEDIRKTATSLAIHIFPEDSPLKPSDIRGLRERYYGAIEQQEEFVMTFPLEVHISVLERFELERDKKAREIIEHLREHRISLRQIKHNEYPGLDQYNKLNERAEKQKWRVNSFGLGEHEALLDSLWMRVENAVENNPGVHDYETEEFKKWDAQGRRVAQLQRHRIK